jgi:uncharacterized lipoprotein YmbA
MRLALSVLFSLLMAGCNSPPLKPSTHLYKTPEQVSVRSVSGTVSIHL